MWQKSVVAIRNNSLTLPEMKSLLFQKIQKVQGEKSATVIVKYIESLGHVPTLHGWVFIEQRRYLIALYCVLGSC